MFIYYLIEFFKMFIYCLYTCLMTKICSLTAGIEDESDEEPSPPDVLWWHEPSEAPATLLPYPYLTPLLWFLFVRPSCFCFSANWCHLSNKAVQIVLIRSPLVRRGGREKSLQNHEVKSKLLYQELFLIWALYCEIIFGMMKSIKSFTGNGSKIILNNDER